MKQVKWFERKFSFDVGTNVFPSIIERLDGTSVRLEEKVHLIPPDILSVRVEDTWTIKENIGHLTDLEPLWQGRLEDIISGKEELRPTDLQNNRTSTANHDATPIHVLLADFRKIRKHTIRMLVQLDEEMLAKSALHPRLKTPMRSVDLFIFVAEHDDHHLARISELVNTLLHFPEH